MNQKLEVALETLINKTTFKINFPWGFVYDEGIQALQQFIDEVIQMKENHIKQNAAANTSSSTVDKMSTD